MTKETRLMIQLAKYKFLCVSHIIRLGWNQSQKTLYDTLSLLREKRYIAKQVYRYNPKYGTVEDIHYLLPKGKSYLEEIGYASGLIKLPKGNSLFYNDYNHRKMCISAQVALAQGIENGGGTVDRYYQYFEKSTNPNTGYKEVATKVTYGQSSLKADTVFTATLHGKQYLYCLEIHNGYRVKKITEQIKAYALGIANGAISSKYQQDTNPDILIVFQEPATMNTTIESISSDAYYMYLKDHYLFKSYDHLLVSPIDGRLNLRGEQVALLDHD